MDPPSEALRLGVALFNQRAFFEQHEVLEEAWLTESGSVRNLYRGILQIGVGFYHLERNNYRGARNLLRYGLRRLEAFEPRCMGVNVAELRCAVTRALETVEGLGPDGLESFDEQLIPRVHLVSTDKPTD
jgi:predicted metal-dependent hydrolase